MTSGQDPIDQQMRGLLERMAGGGILQIALVAFAVGVFLHACVVYAVLDDGQTSSNVTVRPVPANGVTPQSSTPAATTATATPARPADRTSCDAIRGTEYRSETERQWFRTNCP